MYRSQLSEKTDQESSLEPDMLHGNQRIFIVFHRETNIKCIGFICQIIPLPAPKMSVTLRHDFRVYF